MADNLQFETLALLYCYGLEVLPEFQDLVHELGAGLQAVAQTDDSRGLEYYRLPFKTITQTAAQAVVVDSVGGQPITMRGMDYLRDFVRRHRRAKPFKIRHPITEEYVPVVLAEIPRYRNESAYMWQADLFLKDWRGEGYTSSSDETVPSEAYVPSI
jgi:hypothetical protein